MKKYLFSKGSSIPVRHIIVARRYCCSLTRGTVKGMFPDCKIGVITPSIPHWGEERS